MDDVAFAEGRGGTGEMEGRQPRPRRLTPPSPPSTPHTLTTGRGQQHTAFPNNFFAGALRFFRPFPCLGRGLFSPPPRLLPKPRPFLITHAPVSSSLPHPLSRPSLLSKPPSRHFCWDLGWGPSHAKTSFERPSLKGRSGYRQVGGKGGGG